MKHVIPFSLLSLALAVNSHAQSLTFATVATYASGGAGTSGLAVQDLNGDSKPDIVLTNANSATVGVLLNTGTGTFPATATTYATGGGTSPNTNTVAIGDVNADGKADLVALNSTAGTVGVLLGTGTGTFGTATTYSVGNFTYPSGMALADVNSDGRADILVANTSPSAVGVLLALSSGGFASVVQYSASSVSLKSITTGDLNGDGKADLVLGTSDGVAVLLNTGTGTFPASPTAYSAGMQASGLKVGDVTGDGRPDVVTANYFDNTVSVLPGSATGSLGTATTYSAGSGTSPAAVALGDLNKDGRLDIVLANSNYGSAGVLLRQAAGSFPATATQFSVGSNSAPNDVAVADLNGDTKPDIITANFNNARASVLLNTSTLATQPALTAANVTLLPNPAQGSFQALVPGVVGAATVQAELRTALGQLVRQQVLALPTAGTTLTFSTAGLAPGIYLVQLRAGEHTLVQRLAVE